MRARFANCFLLRAAVFVQGAIARFEFAAHARDIFFRRVQLGLARRRVSFAARQASALPSRAREISSRSCRQTRAARAKRGRLRIEVGRRRRQRLQDRKAFSADRGRPRRFPASAYRLRPVRDRKCPLPLWRRCGARQSVSFPLRASRWRSFCSFAFSCRCVSICLMRFLNLRDARRDFFLFLLEFFQRDNFVAHFGKIGRLRAVPSRPRLISLFCRSRFSWRKRHARLLPPNLEADFAQSSANETHRIRLC